MAVTESWISFRELNLFSRMRNDELVGTVFKMKWVCECGLQSGEMHVGV
jgi:hypothetical protein